MKFKKTLVIPIAFVAVTTTAFVLSAFSVVNSNVKPPNIITQKIYASENNVGLVNNEIDPLSINYSGVQYDDGAYRWPGNAFSITNTSSKIIVGYEIASLAYDKNGAPIELYWDALNVAANGEVGSVGFADGIDYGIVTDISPVSPKSYCHVYTHDSTGFLDELKAFLEQGIISEEQAGEIMYGQVISPGEDYVLYYSLFDGWEQSTGEHNVAYIISCVKQVTFENGSTWINPRYEGWLSNYQNKTVEVNVLENYYN